MTTSYRLEAQKKLKAEKKLLREAEAVAQKEQRELEEKKRVANEERIAKKLDRIAKGLPVEDVKPKVKTVNKKDKQIAAGVLSLRPSRCWRVHCSCVFIQLSRLCSRRLTNDLAC